MKLLNEKNTKYYETPAEFYVDLLKDITKATKSIYIETHIFGGKIANELKKELIEKAKEGLEIKILIDHWGLQVKKDFLKELENLGAEIRYFRVFKVTLNFISYNNRRDHRKIVVIDEKINYVGSANINDYSKKWREFIVRIKDEKLAEKLKNVFLDNMKLHDFFFHSAKKHISPIKFQTMDIIRDVPSLRFQKIRNKHLHYIRKAKKEVIIETPYFVPDLKMLLTLINAAKRGVSIKLILPKKSDVKLVDVFVQSLFGKLHKKGVKIYLYKPGFTHSKLSLFDDEVFSFGSANFDYRSFRHQYEIAIFGKDETIKKYVRKHLDKSLKNTEEFNYKEWKKRPLLKRIMEIIIEPFRHFL
jgi:cardiolipin synthase A/B